MTHHDLCLLFLFDAGLAFTVGYFIGRLIEAAVVARMVPVESKATGAMGEERLK